MARLSGTTSLLIPSIYGEGRLGMGKNFPQIRYGGLTQTEMEGLMEH
jgi:hypothetical protein